MKKVYRLLGIAVLLFASMIPSIIIPQNVYADDNLTQINGQVYILDEKDGDFLYEDQKAETSSEDNTYGNFSLSGDLEKTEDKNGIASFNADGIVDEATGEDKSEIYFLYTYDDTLLNADESKEWALCSDGSKKIGNLNLEKKVGNGAIVVQSSFDGENWSDSSISTNVFKKTAKNKSKPFYATTINQLVNGCYYRVIIAYQTRKQSGKQKIGPVKTWDTYDYKEHVEIYDFYICNLTESAKATKPTDTPYYNLNSDPVNTGMDNGYSGNNAVKTNDVQNGWSIGQFYINGFSGSAHFYSDDERKKENPIFLKNVGDKVTLWFHLDQKNLNALNENENLSINADDKGSDQYFHISKQNFKRGALIIKFTDYQGNVKKNVYTDYLASAATTSADTKVQLFEEGDYEVALDYEIRDNSPLAWKIPKPAKITAYRISFKFTLRNSNCMVYPIDLKTGGELTVPYTSDGFRLDLAKSRYLNLSVKRRVLTDNGLDVRSSEAVSDQTEFTDEGIYEFTVENEITKDKVSKPIYVGTNNLLKAYVKYGKDYGGKYSIDDLKEMQDSGYEFTDDGTIVAPSSEKQEELNDSAKIVSSESNEQETSAEDVPTIIKEESSK